MESLRENELIEAKEFFTAGVIAAQELGYSVPTISTIIMGILFNLIKNVYKMSDEEAINLITNAYIKYPKNGEIATPLREM